MNREKLSISLDFYSDDTDEDLEAARGLVYETYGKVKRLGVPPAHPGTVTRPAESSPEHSITISFDKESDIDDLEGAIEQIYRLYSKATR